MSTSRVAASLEENSASSMSPLSARNTVYTPPRRSRPRLSASFTGFTRVVSPKDNPLSVTNTSATVSTTAAVSAIRFFDFILPP